MGEISVNRQNLNRLLTDSAQSQGVPYQQAFSAIAVSYRGRPPHEIIPALKDAADRALLGFSWSDLREQAEAISSGRPYTLRVTVTGR